VVGGTASITALQAESLRVNIIYEIGIAARSQQNGGIFHLLLVSMRGNSSNIIGGGIQ